MSNSGQNSENVVTSDQNESIEEINNRTLARVDSTSTADLPPLPPLPGKEASIVCCCLTIHASLRFYLITYWTWSLLAFVCNIDTVHPALYLFPLCTMLMAFIGSTTDTFQLLIPFMFMLAYDMLYATTCAVFVVSFHNNDRNVLLNKFLRDYWSEKAEEFNAMNHESFELFLIIFLFKAFYAMAGLVITGQEITRFRVQLFIEKRRREINRQRELLNLREETRLRSFLNEAMQRSEEPRNLCAQLFSMHPPPPSYQTFSHPVLRTPELGTPPPTYSMLEREGRFIPVPVQWSSASSEESQERMDSSEISITYKSFDHSTAMSPSSFLHSPPSTKE